MSSARNPTPTPKADMAKDLKSQPPVDINSRIQFENYMNQLREKAILNSADFPDGRYLDYDSVKKLCITMIHNTRRVLGEKSLAPKSARIKLARYMNEVIRPSFNP